ASGARRRERSRVTIVYNAHENAVDRMSQSPVLESHATSAKCPFEMRSRIPIVAIAIPVFARAPTRSFRTVAESKAIASGENAMIQPVFVADVSVSAYGWIKK